MSKLHLKSVACVVGPKEIWGEMHQLMLAPHKRGVLMGMLRRKFQATKNLSLCEGKTHFIFSLFFSVFK